MRSKFEIFRCVEIVLYTVLSFVLAATIMYLLREFTGWTYSEWSMGSQICVYVVLVVLMGSIFCRIYEGVDYIFYRFSEKKYSQQAAQDACLDESSVIEEIEDELEEEIDEEIEQTEEKEKKFVIVDFHM